MIRSERGSFIDFLLLLTKWRKFILINLFIVGIVSLIVSFQLPKWYKATAVVMPPADNQAAGGLSALMSSLPIGGLGLGGGGEMTYMAILKSKSYATDIIKKFDLQSFYENETMFEAYLSFYGDFDAQLTEENMIAISFEYTDSVRVAEIVNYMIEKLAIRSTDLMIEKAGRTKKYIEKRYLQNLHDIDSLAIAIEMFNKRYGIIEFETQTKALIEMAAKIESEIFIKEAELKAIESSFGKGSPQYNTKKNELDVFQKQFRDLTNDKFNTSENPFSSLFISFKELPKLSREYAELYANYLLLAKLQEYLLPEYEQAKLQVQKDDPTLQIIDSAVPPDWKSKPKKAFIILGALVVAFVLQMLIILLFEYIIQMEREDPERFKQFEKLRNAWSFKSNKNQT
jgi:capsule polysaccharide export protein KpsE/RkpR